MAHPTLLNTYNPLPVSFSHGKGVWLWDTDNKRYLDALGGIAVCALGHDHPAITAAISAQAKLLQTSNLYQIQNQEALADKLCQLSQMDGAFFANSGCEANEAAIKLCRLYGHKQNIDKPQIIVMEKAFHGRTLATLSACGSRKVHAGFEPLVQGFIRAPFNDLGAIENIANTQQNVVAVMLEPIQGEGGINPADSEYIKGLRALCDKQGWLLVFDEIQTGVGRTGQFFAYQHHGILPDIVTSAKALGNGIPIGACLAQGKAATLFQPGNHGSTFGGNPFCTKVALTVLETIEKDDLINKAKHWGEYLKQQLTTELADNKHVLTVRGQGLMMGIELDTPCRDILYMGLEEGLLFNITSEKVIRLLPPYIINQEEADLIISKLTSIIKNYTNKLDEADDKQ